MQVNIELYGVLRQHLGSEMLTLQFPGCTVGDALQQLCLHHPQLAPELPVVACAIGSDLVTRTHILSGRETLALIPPVSGGES